MMIQFFSRKKDCANTDCPMGYGCYSDGQCKKVKV